MFYKVAQTICIATIALLLLACKAPQEDTPSSKVKIIAKAGDKVLNADEFRTNFVSTGIIKDSSYNAKKSIESWATESLFYQEALSKLVSEEIQIEEQVEEYRQTLVNYIYQSKLVEANLDTLVSPDEIESYYNDHRDNFILKDNIVKVNYLKVPLKAQGLPKIKRLLWSVNEKDKLQLLELCSQNAENFFLNDSTWLFLDDIKKEIPALKEQPDFSLRTGKVLEFSDEEYYYFLKIKDEKVKNGLSPLIFERNNIKKFILNNRKSQLVSQYKQIMLEKAKADKRFVIY
ncbi:MAG: hypothetical protein PSX36_08450 [bacterium]|nr:hypothetical protein [bacterium]